MLPPRGAGLALPDEDTLERLSTTSLRDEVERRVRTGQYLPTLPFVEELLRRSPEDAEAWLLAARIHSRQPETSDAADRAFQRASTLTPLSMADYETWLGIRMARGAVTPARLVLAKMDADHGGSLEARLKVLLYFERLGDPAAAFERASSGLDELPGELTADQTQSWLQSALRTAPEGWVATPEVSSALRGLTKLSAGCALACAQLLLRGGRPQDALGAAHADAHRGLADELASVRAQAHVDQDHYLEAAAEYDHFPPSDLTGELNHLLCLVTIGRPDEARERLETYAAALAQVPRPLTTQPLQEVLDYYVLLREMFAMLLSEAANDFDSKWVHLRELVRLESLGYGPDVPAIKVLLLRLRMLLEPDWSGRQETIALLEDELSRSRADEEVATGYVESLLWASQVSPPLGQRDPAPGSPLRQKAEAVARSRLVRAATGPKRSECIKNARLALLIGDRLTADALLGQAMTQPGPEVSSTPGGSADRWQEVLLRALVAMECHRRDEALRLMTGAMGQWRQDLDARLCYAHLTRVCGDIEKATIEAVACVEAAPHHVSAGIMKAECLFDFALASIARRTHQSTGATAPTGGAKPDAERGPTTSQTGVRSVADSESSDNLQQLIRVVAEYRRVIELHNCLRDWLASGDPEEAPRGVGSDLLSALRFEEVCRQGLHAAVLASEGLARYGMTRDRQLDEDVTFLVAELRGHQGSGRPRRGLAGVVRWRNHRDEAERLHRLFRANKKARRDRLLRRMAYMVAGAAVFIGSQVVPLPDELRVGFGFAGLALLLVPLFPSVKLAGIELALRPDDEVMARRSDVLRSAPVWRFENQILGGLPVLPSSVSRHDGVPDRAGVRVDQALSADEDARAGAEPERSRDTAAAVHGPLLDGVRLAAKATPEGPAGTPAPRSGHRPREGVGGGRDRLTGR